MARSAVLISEAEVEIQFVVGLPAFGRRVAGIQAAEMLCEDLPAVVDQVLYRSLDAAALQRQVETAEDADWLRQQLSDCGLVAFVANGAVLPRRSGVDDRPLRESSVPFRSPASLEVELTCPNAGKVVSMGIPKGVSLIVGNGYPGYDRSGPGRNRSLDSGAGGGESPIEGDRGGAASSALSPFHKPTNN